MAASRKAVIFDLGGVLLQWQPFQVLQQVVPELAPDEAAARVLAARLFQSFVPGSPWADFDRGRVDEPTLALRLAAALTDDYAATVQQMRRVIDAVPSHLAALPDSVALLMRVKARGHRLFFLSNMPAPYAARLAAANEFLAAFDDGLYSAHVGLLKPEPGIFSLASERFELDAAQTIFIDDHADNVAAARHQGWQALHFQTAAQAAVELAAGGWL
jgi:putative hydrolase of the HAD superfamily